MKKEHTDWIAQNYPTQQAAYGKCSEACDRMIAAFPELKKVRGHYYCLIWGEREHWWCEDRDGTIVDPTRKQFPTQSDTAYSPWVEGAPEPTGKCPNCGDLCYDGRYCCSESCERAYAAYCMGGGL